MRPARLTLDAATLLFAAAVVYLVIAFAVRVFLAGRV